VSYCRLSDADIYLYEDNEGVVCFGKNGHQAYGMTKKEAIEHVHEHRKNGDYVPEYVDTILQAEYIDELELKLSEARARLAWIPVSERLPEDGESVLAVISSAFNPHQIILLARHYSERPEWVTDDAFYYYDKEYERITHWMPLPKAPKEDE
jgi:hypothetical protein